jgi:hypothetical protein
VDDAEKPHSTSGTNDNSRIEPVVIGHRFTQASERLSRVR